MTMIKTNSIRLDGGTQPRTEIDWDAVDEYAELVNSNIPFKDPIVVFYDGTNYWLADGFHRVHATLKTSFREIEAQVYSGSQRDAILYSVGANASHGQRRTNEDKRRAVLTMLTNDLVRLDPKTGEPWSNREIARRCAVDEGTVRKHRVGVTAELPQLDPPSESVAYTTKHGTVATMNTSNIGQRKSEPVEDEEEPITHIDTIRDTRNHAQQEDVGEARSSKVEPPVLVQVRISQDPISAANALYIHFGRDWVSKFADHIIQRVRREENEQD